MAAVEIASGVADPDLTAAIKPLLDSLNDVLAQFARGVTHPSVPFTNISTLGSEPLNSWKTIIEQSLNVPVELRVSLDTNAIIIIPVRRFMSSDITAVQPVAPDNQLLGSGEVTTPGSDDATASADSAKKVVKKGRAKDKAPRPKNAFIIYRKEWHPKIVEHFPDLHNNDISVLIGRQWKDESDDVKAKYKVMAAEEKRQHLIDHPGYQYQPRKPSEKKKRMTKNKLAKLKAQSADDNYDPMQEIDGLLAAAAADHQVTINTFQAPYRQGLPVVHEGSEATTFTASDSHADLLFNQLTALNANQSATQSASNNMPIASQICVDGHALATAQRYDLPADFSMQEIYKLPERVADQRLSTSTTSNFSSFAGNAEADRQQILFDDALMNDLFDLDAFDVEID